MFTYTPIPEQHRLRDRSQKCVCVDFCNIFISASFAVPLCFCEPHRNITDLFMSLSLMLFLLFFQSGHGRLTRLWLESINRVNRRLHPLISRPLHVLCACVRVLAVLQRVRRRPAPRSRKSEVLFGTARFTCITSIAFGCEARALKTAVLYLPSSLNLCTSCHLTWLTGLRVPCDCVSQVHGRARIWRQRIGGR